MKDPTNPDLGDQLSHILASLEKATPQVLELATRTMRQEALFNGLLELTLLISSLLAARWFWRWQKSAKDFPQDDLLRMGAVFSVISLVILAVVMFCQLPDNVSKFCNARYYAIVYLLQRVK